MPETDFNAAFKSAAVADAPPPFYDPHEIARQIMRRDQSRTRMLATASLLFWLIGAAGMILLLVGLNRFVIGIRIEHLMPWNQGHASAGGQGRSEQEEQFLLEETDLLHHSMPYIAGSVGALLLAALFTVMLVFSSRQATLNRINISLAQIADQIRHMKDGPRAGDSSPPSTDYLATIPAPNRPAGRLAFWGGWLIALLAIGGLAVVWFVHPPERTQAAWQGYPMLSPFEAVRWIGQTPQVEVSGNWYELVAVNDVTVSQIVAFDQSLGPQTWQKHFNEDLVELLTRMGHKPETAVTLKVKDPSTKNVLDLKNVQMTAENRAALWRQVGLAGSDATTEPARRE